MHAKIESKSKKKSIALQQSSNYKTIKQRRKKDNPIFICTLEFDQFLAKLFLWVQPCRLIQSRLSVCMYYSHTYR